MDVTSCRRARTTNCYTVTLKFYAKMGQEQPKDIGKPARSTFVELCPNFVEKWNIKQPKMDLTKFCQRTQIQ